MKYAICNETFLEWPFEQACSFARECGYTGIEIAPFMFDNDVRNISSQQRAQIKQQADAAGLEVVGLHWLLAKTTGLHLTSPDASVRQATADYIKELVHCCGDLAAGVMVFGSPLQRNLAEGMSLEQGHELAAEVFRQVVPVLEQRQVVLALEPLGPTEGNFLNTADEGVQLMERIDSPTVRLHLDTKAMSSEPTPIPDIIRKHAGVMAHFHANDPNKLGPGFGELDFVPIFQALKDVNYDGWVSVEVFDYSPGVERLAKESIDYMRKCESQLT